MSHDRSDAANSYPCQPVPDQPPQDLQRFNPICATIRRRPLTDSAICTAVAPEAVRTRRIHATHPTVEHQLVPQNSHPRTHHPRSASRTLPERDAVTKLRPGASAGI